MINLSSKKRKLVLAIACSAFLVLLIGGLIFTTPQVEAAEPSAANSVPPSIALNEGQKLSSRADYDRMFVANGRNIELTPLEKKAIDNYNKWATSGARSKQTTYTDIDGATVFTYGAQPASIVCALLQITDLELERGESINSVNIGDSSRWSIEPAVEGKGSSMIQHVLIKPLDVGIETNMLITTDRRSYRVHLKAKDAKNFNTLVRFVFPEQALAKFEALKQLKQEERERNSITTEPESGVKTYLGDLNFNYEIDGDVSWKPIRVFDDGVKTIIEMPKSMLARNAPSLMVLDKAGGLFTDEKVSIINYRLQDTRYVVDGLFDQAILTLDIGSDQQRVVIKRLGE